MADEIRVTRTTDGPVGGAASDRGALDAEPGLGDLLKQLAQDSATLVRQEVALAKAEMQHNLKAALRDAAMAAVGGVVAVLGLLVLLVAVIVGLSDALDEPWLGPLIVGILFLIVGGILAKKSLDKLKGDSLTPDQTMETLKEDKQWLQSEIKQARRDLA